MRSAGAVVEEGRSRMNRWERFGRYYTVFSIQAMTAVLLFVLLNLLCLAFFRVRAALFPTNPVVARYGAFVKDVYPELTDAEMQGLLSETYSRPLIYEQFTQFKERPFRGQFVNVSPHGFRHSRNQGAWPPDGRSVRVFLFGGSTAFGYGVSDSETVASYLQDGLANLLGKEVRVYNFGRGHYYSTQERVLFTGLLVDGATPDIAIFLDGLNEFEYAEDRPYFTRLLERFIDGDPVTMVRWGVAALPVYQAAFSASHQIRSWWSRAAPANEQKGAVKEADMAEAAVVRRIVERYIANKTMIERTAERYGLEAVLVWQPVPFYKYDAQHVFASLGYGEHHRVRPGYAQMAERRASEDLGRNFLWCADVQQGRSGPLYVDLLHYSAAMSRIIAECVIEGMREKGLVSVMGRK